MPSIIEGHEPGSRYSALWRFMDFTKYVAMLDRRGLFFARADQLIDPFEGALARANLAPRGGHEKLQRRVFVHCWHMNEHESAAMWRMFLRSDHGVAVQTTVGRLCEAFDNDDTYFGKVRYLDYRRELVPDGDELVPFLCKSMSFAHEQEVRLIARHEHPPEELGYYVEADIGRLVAQVVVSPTAEGWFADLVRSVTAKYGYDLAVEPSTIYRDPTL